ncbi:MAG: hypothetical protein HRT47_05535 [Candidatus Caenarcaniphilales bacterium]|nr:hypothetical protein [Candidatus Caenarcaniphilales bacterium]
MLFEALEYFHNSSRCPKYLKDFGQLSEIIAIKARAKRCYKSWENHLNNSKAFINMHLDLNPNIYGSSSILIFGAGMCNDLDLYYLGDNFDKVILLDLFFLKSTREALSKYNNVFFCELDISNSMEKIHQLATHYKDNYPKFLSVLKQFSEKNKLTNSLKEHSVFNLIKNNETNNVVSLNLLSQIPLAYESFFEKTLKKDYREEDCAFFYKYLIKEHLHLLTLIKKMNKNVLLLTDIQKYVSDSSGKEKDKESSLHGINLVQHLGKIDLKEKWYWDLAPVGEINNSYAMKLLINAIKL